MIKVYNYLCNQKKKLIESRLHAVKICRKFKKFGVTDTDQLLIQIENEINELDDLISIVSICINDNELFIGEHDEVE